MISIIPVNTNRKFTHTFKRYMLDIKHLMYQKKTSQRETQEKTKYTIHAYKGEHTHPLSFLFIPSCQPSQFIQVVSIDPATDNFAFRIEKRWINGYIETVCSDKVKFNRLIREDGYMSMFSELVLFLDKFKTLYAETSLFIIERQMAINFNATRVVHIIFGYYTTYIMGATDNLSRVLIEIDPKVKGLMLGSPKGCDKPSLKKWGIDEATKLLNARKDFKGISNLNSYKKRDDIADTVIQIEAFFKLIGLPLTGQSWTQTIEFSPIIIIDDEETDSGTFFLVD